MSSFLVDGCSLSAGFACPKNDFKIRESWPSFLKSNVLNIGYQGKDNHAIFQDTLHQLDYINKNTIVIVYWSYTDRASSFVAENNHVVRDANKHISKLIYEQNNIDLLHAYTNLSLTYMKALQDVMQSRGINYYYLTTMPYSIYKASSKTHFNGRDYGRMLRSINQKKVLNWEETEYKSYGYRADLWVHSLPVLFGLTYDCLNYDGVHLTYEGEKLFSEWILNSIYNGKSIPKWNVDKSLAWASKNCQERDIHHSTRSGLHALLNYATKTTNFIYEGA